MLCDYLVQILTARVYDVAQETQEAHLGPPPGRRVVNVEVRDRPVSQVASLGSDSDDEFEDLPLH